MKKFYVALFVLFSLFLLVSCQKEEPRTGTEHVWSRNYTVVAPTEKEEGARVYSCLLCGEKKETEIPRLTDENYFVIKTEPTCEEEGLYIYTSEEWGEYEVDYPALGHDFPTSPDHCTATCTANGDDVYVCNRCHAEKTVEKSAFGHDYVLYAVVEGSCVEKGYTEYQCRRCGVINKANETDYVHDYVKGEYVPGSCTQKGYYPYTCRLCQAVKKEEKDYLHLYNKDTGACDQCVAECPHDFDDYVCSICHFDIREELCERSGIFCYGDLVYFGTYPQSHVSDEELIEELDQAFATGSGDERTLYGITYVRANVKNQSNRIYDFSDGTPMSTVTTGREIHYFRYDPIIWRRARGDVFVADCILETGVYQYKENYTTSGSLYFYADESDVYANNWSVSALREFLNGEFYTKAFNQNQKALIVPSQNDNTESGYYPPSENRAWCTQEATEDNVFLPSFADLYEKDAVTDERNEALIKKLSDYTLCSNVKIEGGEGKTATWLLRSSGLYSMYVCAIDSEGKLSSSTLIYKEKTINGTTVVEKMGIAPAIKLDLPE